MMRQDDPMVIWEQDGDLELMKAFFGGLTQNRDKDRIKEMVLAKLAHNNEVEAGFNEDAPVLEEPRRVGEPKSLRNEFGRAASLKNLSKNIKIRGQKMWKRWGWKLAVPAAAVVLIAFMWQGGLSDEPGKGSLLSKADSRSSATEPAAAPSYNANTEAQRQKSSYSMADVGAAKSQESSDRQIVTGGLAQAQNDSVSNAKGIVPPVPPVPEPVVPPADEDLPRKIIQNLNVTLQVEDIESTLQKISEMALGMGGYVVDSQMDNQQSTGYSTAHITLKVPAAKFENARSSMSEIGKILTQHLSANDITNQYYDADTRLKHWQAEEERYTDILNQAKTIEEILRVEDALSNIRMQIEQLRGQLKLWSHETAFSTIQVQLQAKPNPVNIDEPWQPVSWGKTWEAAWNAVLKTISSIWNALNYLVVGLGYALPFVVLGAIGYLGYRLWRKARTK